MKFDQPVSQKEVNPESVDHKKLVTSKMIRLSLMFIMTIAIVVAILVLIVVVGVSMLIG